MSLASIIQVPPLLLIAPSVNITWLAERISSTLRPAGVNTVTPGMLRADFQRSRLYFQVQEVLS